jgi:hypothetical protein
MAETRLFPSLGADLSCCRLHSRHAQQVVRRTDEVGSELGFRNPDESAFSQPPTVFIQPKISSMRFRFLWLIA